MIKRTFTPPWQDYQLIDAGNQQKLERWGNIITIRPEVNANYTPGFPLKQWREKAHFEFVEETRNAGNWKVLKAGTPEQWQITFNAITLNLQLTKFKHLGLFPEQRTNWDYIASHLNNRDRFLNLFAYTGGASLVARAQGADVFHCDSVKQIIKWGKDNMLSSGLDDIHWVLEDALKFAQREIKRERKYQGIIMDPPAFGIGAKKERWKIENKFAELIEAALALRDKGGFIIANTYSPRLDSKRIREITKEYSHSEKTQVTTLSVKSQTGKVLDYGLRTLITE